MPQAQPTLLMVHGAGSGPWVFDGWSNDMPGWHVAAVDLQEGLDPASAGMADYAGAVVKAARTLQAPLVLLGWSMGGLIALMATAAAQPDGLVLIEPSPPAELQGHRPDIAVRDGTYDPEEVYGPLPNRLRPRPESVRARIERKRGISVPPPLPCPSIVVFGSDFPDTRGRDVARLYDAEAIDFPGFSHSALVARSEVRHRLLISMAELPAARRPGNLA